MVEKIKHYLKYSFIEQARDVRFLGLIVFGIIVLLASWSGVNVIETNFELQKQVAKLDQQNQVQQLTNTNQKLQNEYYKTDTYLELTARKQLGKGAPGEKLLLVPKNVALSRTKQLPDPALKSPASDSLNKPTYRKNFDAWMNFFLHKSS